MKKLFILILFFALLQVGFAKKVATLPELINAEIFIVDGDKFFVSESVNVYIYNLKDFKLLKKFGKAGEGPQEFKINAMSGGLVMDVQPDYIYVSSLDKISYFTRDGDFKKETKKQTLYTTYFFPIGSRHVGVSFAEEGKHIFQTVVLYDAKFKKVKELFRQDHFYQLGKFNPVGQLPFVDTVKDKIVVGGDKGIFIYNADGELEVNANEVFDKVKVEESHRKKADDYYRTDPGVKHLYQNLKRNFQFPEYFALLKSFTVGNDKIYVETYKRKDNKSEFVILDLKGKLVKKTFLPVAEKNMFEPYPYSVFNGKFYQLIENMDEEEWELHMVPIE